MEKFQHSSSIKQIQGRPHRISISFDGSYILMLQYQTLFFYKKIDGQYQQILQQQMNFTRWEILQIQLHSDGQRFSIIELTEWQQNRRYLYYKNYILNKKTMAWQLYHRFLLFQKDFQNRNPLDFQISQSLDYLNTQYNQTILEDLMGVYQFQSLYKIKIIRNQQLKGNCLKYLKQLNIIVSITSKRIIIYDYYQCIVKHEFNIKSQVYDVVSDLDKKLYIYCSRGLIEWDLIENKKKNEYNIDHQIFKHLGYQVQLYYLKGAILLFNKEHEYYVVTLKVNQNKVDKFPRTQYENFLSNDEGSMYLLFTHNKKSQNYFRVFSYQN